MTTTPPAGTPTPVPADPGPDGEPVVRRSRSASQGSGRATTGTPDTRPGSESPSRRGQADHTDRREAGATASSRRSGEDDTDADTDTDPGGVQRRVLGYRRQRFAARKVRRLLRHIDPWSMLKLSLLVSLCMWLIVMIASVILWTVASNAGTISSIESFVNSSLSLQDWNLDGDFLFRQFGLITLLLSLAFAAATVIATLVFNLVSDIIGGVWISVIEEESARPVPESKPAQRVG